MTVLVILAGIASGILCIVIGYAMGKSAPTNHAYRKGARDAYATMAEQATQDIIRKREAQDAASTITPTVIP